MSEPTDVTTTFAINLARSSRKIPNDVAMILVREVERLTAAVEIRDAEIAAQDAEKLALLEQVTRMDERITELLDGAP